MRLEVPHPNDDPRTDVLILGGGCAGLSLAHRLVTGGFEGSIAIIEPREAYGRDRTWCFWLDEDADRADPADALPEAVRAAIRWRWPAWRIVGEDGEEVRRSMPGLSYAGLASSDFYEAILPSLAGVSWYRGWSARHVAADYAIIERGGETRRVVATSVVDTRPPSGYAPNPDRPGRMPAADGEAALVQQFVGGLYRGRFDPGVATLMRFDGGDVDSNGLGFLYVLPTGDGEALCEWTGMLKRPLGGDEAQRRLEALVAEAHPDAEPLNGGYRESGVLPMSSASDAVPADGIVRLGIRGGAARPSTGYAFLQIQRQARAAADSLPHRRGELSRSVPSRPLHVRCLDKIFLRKLRKKPGIFPVVFARLFDRVRPDRLARFLADVPSARDAASVVWAMPKVPFAAEAIAGSRPIRLLKGVDWQQHRRLAVPMTIAATLLIVLLAQVAAIPWTLQVALVALAATVGMAHGATDVWLGPRVFGDDPAGRRWFGGWYVATTLAALGLYAIAPGAWLIGFLALAAVHFGFGELPGLLPRSAGEAATSAVRALMPISLPALLYAGDVSLALSALAPGVAAGVTTALSTLAFPTILGSAALAITLALRREAWPAAEVAALAALLVFVPPLLAFAVYFAIWHSLRHLLSDVVDAPAGGPSRPWLPVVGATAAPILVAAAIWMLVSVVPGVAGWTLTPSSSAIRIVFVTLGCLTVPHMALVLIAARRGASGTDEHQRPPPARVGRSISGGPRPAA